MEKKKIGIEIICPLYEAEEYIENLHHSIQKQKNVIIDKITYIVTKGNDSTEKVLQTLNCEYEVINKEEFSHSLTRELFAMKSKSEIIVFITQDIIIKDDMWLHNLTKYLISGKCEATYSRQVAKEGEKGIEKYTREKNYPKYNKFVTKKDVSEMGLKAFFSSDASSATLTRVFKELNGFDRKRLSVSEDMYYAKKIIFGGYTMGYIAESVIYHSHNFNFRQQYERYREIGKFFGDNPEFDQYRVTESGLNLAMYILKRSVEERNIYALIKFIPDMVARIVGMRKGRRIVKANNN